jgi:hypothetical protein
VSWRSCPHPTMQRPDLGSRLYPARNIADNLAKSRPDSRLMQSLIMPVVKAAAVLGGGKARQAVAAGTGADRVSGFSEVMERRRPRHSHPAPSHRRIREVAIAKGSRIRRHFRSMTGGIALPPSGRNSGRYPKLLMAPFLHPTLLPNSLPANSAARRGNFRGAGTNSGTDSKPCR